MKHQWKTDPAGEPIPVDEDSDHPQAVCVTCGKVSACLEFQERGYRCWAADDGPMLDADDCKGVDLTVKASFTIYHPGAATVAEDARSIGERQVVTVELIVDAYADPVEQVLAELVEAAAAQWRIAKAAHHEDWERALIVASRQADTEGAER